MSGLDRAEYPTPGHYYTIWGCVGYIKNGVVIVQFPRIMGNENKEKIYEK